MNEVIPLEKTFVLLKPDAVRRGLMGEIIHRFESRGLKIIAVKMIAVKAEHAKKHYAEHEGKPFFSGLVGFLSSGPVLAMVMEGVNAIKAVRKIVGSTNPEEAVPGTIRGDFSHHLPDGGKNLIHASANPTDAEKEIELWFSPNEINSYRRNDESDVI